ncbi:hypothetical protein [Streptomyces iconiensis]|uniref:Uncharacterized protein n=1 Tax=Streptomyces iconiensis TaxID=1384038 RepID=A0ABT7A4P1_9ACTN|nr:hypothetical protein [Streptomyces iconiensis]MDJ1135776.1 hypothetical protein [Streptomyces iconiensis]
MWQQAGHSGPSSLGTGTPFRAGAAVGAHAGGRAGAAADGGIDACARLRLAAPVTAIGPSAVDPATGRRPLRLLAPLCKLRAY